MSGVFFEDLDLPAPEFNLNIGSAPHGIQTGEVMIRLEPILEDPSLPTCCWSYRRCEFYGRGPRSSARSSASAIGARRGWSALARSGRYPEEINRHGYRRHLADVLFTPSLDANDNLAAEGVASARVAFVGNVMIDTLVRLRPRARVHWPMPTMRRMRPSRSSRIPSAVQRGRPRGPSEPRRRTGHALDAAAHPVPRPSANPRPTGRHAPGAWAAAGRAARLPGVSRTRSPRGRGCHGFGRHSGGDDISGHSMRDGSREHGSAR